VTDVAGRAALAIGADQSIRPKWYSQYRDIWLGYRISPGMATAGQIAGCGSGADWIAAMFAVRCAEVLTMGLTWRDLVSTVTALAIVLADVAFHLGAGLPLMSSAWSASGVLLVLSAVCAVSAAGDLHTRPQPRHGVIFRRITTVLGAIALGAGLAGLISGSGRLMELLVVATIFLYATGTLWHVLSIGAPE